MHFERMVQGYILFGASASPIVKKGGKNLETGVDIIVGEDLEKELGNIPDMYGFVFIKKLKTSSNFKQIGF
jgi:hypothetical protein